jgi:hypothetical protein
MSARVLAIVTRGQESAALAGLTGLVTVARAARADVRLAYLHPLPPPRQNRNGWVVAEADVEMARIASAASRSFEAAARAFEDVRTEVVVRFGRPPREALLEADTYAPDLAVCFATPGATPLARLQAWRVRYRLARRPDTRLLVLEPGRPSAGPCRPAVTTPPVRLPARHG